MDKLIEKLELLKTDSPREDCYHFDRCNNEAVNCCIALMTQHTEGKVLVSAEDFKELINIAIWRQDSREDRERLIGRCQAMLNAIGADNDDE
jgi:hypothetical protein